MSHPPFVFTTRLAANSLRSIPMIFMDTGHFNCRDYVIAPLETPAAPSTVATESNLRPTLWTGGRHESFAELEHRSRSPASMKPKFPLLKLPLELRQTIFSYLLPHTEELSETTNPLTSHIRAFSAVQKRMGKEMPASPNPSNPKTVFKINVTNVVWKRGCTALMAVCRQLHDECADSIYGDNVFTFLVTYEAITFRYRFSVPSGLARTTWKNLTELPLKYRTLIKRVVVHIDHVDSYTGMVKFNMSGSGLTHGMRQQAQRLVTALRPSLAPNQLDSIQHSLAKISIRVTNGNFVNAIRDRSAAGRNNRGSASGCLPAEELDEMLYPFGQFWGVREVSVKGDVTEQFARDLEERMSSPNPETSDARWVLVETEDDKAARVMLCVYGNDI
ncbi:Hypothetical protein R9X50_00004500 [Acrodontium crateriforme]|uniref:DUF7730 domain-containing protein n=1 Tax=Acrodontium crateriforme TaxID=150365 RepID=A0AAQ3M2L3_9PEZI|nr:Hypothetical protein R9X50_00004500 [Acrodontium crateriforme]